VNQLLTSVVREICTLRSVGAGERATAPGHPVVVRHHDPYSDHHLGPASVRQSVPLIFDAEAQYDIRQRNLMGSPLLRR
jgi:hypothetical protein